MGTKSAEEVLGQEFDWLARDADAHVALFTTAGGGYAPDAFLRDTDAHDEAIEQLLASNATTRARFAPELRAGSKNTWRMMAERGLFAFDSDAYGGPYRLVAAPEVPVRVDAMPALVARVVRDLQFRDVRFGESSVVPTELLRRVR